MFKVGFSRVDVTPPLGTELTGYFHKRYAEGVLDPLYLNALALSDGENTALIITGDFMYVLESAMSRYRGLIEKRTGLSKDSIMLHTIHQHTSTTAGIGGPTDAVYQDFLERKYCDAAQMALDDMAEAAAFYAEGETEKPISFVRRFRMKDGTVRTNPGRLNPDIVAPIGEADNTVRLIKIVREGKKDIALVGFQTHPDVVGGSKISADWPGFVRRLTEKALDNTHCILINGCQGDVNHIDVTATVSASKDPVLRYAHARYMGESVSSVAVSLWDKAEPIDTDGVSCQIKYTYAPSNPEGADEIAEMTKIFNDYTEGKIQKPTMAEAGRWRRIASMTRTMLVQTIPVTVVAFGKVAILGYAGEPFTEYAVKLRNAFPELTLLTACLVNGAQGYFPSAEAFAEGGYEASSSVFLPDIAPNLQGVAKELLQNVVDGKAKDYINDFQKVADIL